MCNLSCSKVVRLAFAVSRLRVDQTICQQAASHTHPGVRFTLSVTYFLLFLRLPVDSRSTTVIHLPPFLAVGLCFALLVDIPRQVTMASVLQGGFLNRNSTKKCLSCKKNGAAERRCYICEVCLACFFKTRPRATFGLDLLCDDLH